MVEEDGFEPSKSVTTDLQSAPFGRSGTPPYSVMSCGGGAGGRIRTPDLLITNQLLYQLSYTSTGTCSSAAKISLSDGKRFVKHFLKKEDFLPQSSVGGERRQRGGSLPGPAAGAPPLFSAPNAARNNIPDDPPAVAGLCPNAAGGTDNERRML